MRSGFDKTLALALSLSALSPVMAFMPTDDAEPANLNKPAAEAGLTLRQVSSLAGKAAGIAVLSADGARVSALSGKLSSPTKADAKTIALGFANSKLGRARFEAIDSQTSEGVTHVRLVQKVEGLEVFGPDLTVHIDGDGTINMVNGTAIENTTPVNTAKLDAQAASTAAARALGDGKIETPARVLFPAADGLRHAWKLELTSPGASWVTVVDAQDGSILMASNQVRHITGTGSIYQMDPLHGAPSNEPLLNLKGNGLLHGSFVDVRNEDNDRAKADDHKFIYEPDNTHFDESMVYFHLDKVHAYFKSLGFSDLDKPIVATVHVGDRFDNAYFDPRSGSLSFGDGGNRLNDLSKDATVAYHEYGHAVTNAIVGMMFGGEGGGMHEGYSDYFAGTITDDPVIGGYAGQRLPSGNIRNMDNTLHYPEDSGSEPHKAGRIWGGACWDVRKALGPEVTDKIVHQSRFYIPKWGPKFADAYQGILKADQKLYGGSHAAKVTEIFTKRGIAKGVSEMALRDVLRQANFQDLGAKAGVR
ncbi:MAG: M36 family metallopeptidase [Candidatus Wallbacteria bacterium]|nr:M36 family metallopeptidase [Candidatus Wallbacteria bacterium]